MKKFFIMMLAVAGGVALGIRVEKSIPEQHAVLEVNLVPDTLEEYKDSILLENALRQGGSLDMATNREYTKFLRAFDDNFEAFATVDQDNNYIIRSAILNWISSKGWKLISISADRDTYVFVR